MSSPPPPGPTELQNLLLARQLFTDPREPIMENTSRHGLIWQTRIPFERGTVPLTWLMGPAGNERVLSPKHRDDFSFREGYSFKMEPLLGSDVLFLLDDEPDDSGQPAGAHRERLRLLSPAFHPGLDSAYLAEMAAIIGPHLARLPMAQPIDIAHEIKHITFAILSRLLLGAPPDEQEHLRGLVELLGRGQQSRLRLRIPGTRFYRARRARAELLGYLGSKLAAYRRDEGQPPLMLAQLRLQQSAAGDRLPDDTLAAEMLALLLGGYDPTASLLTSLMVALGETPEVFRRLRDEMRVTVSRLDGLLPSEPVDAPYLDAVLLELERLYPPLPFAIRGVRRDFEFGGYQIQKGHKVAYSAYYTGRMPEVFDDPLTFAPERFLGRKGAGVIRPQPYTLLGFGGGHRMCVGKRFAVLQLRLFISVLLQRFDVEFLDQESEAIVFNPTLQRKHGFWVRLHRRHLSLPTVTEL